MLYTDNTGDGTDSESIHYINIGLPIKLFTDKGLEMEQTVKVYTILILDYQ